MSADPNLWAMDIDSVMKQPYRAHLIVAVENLGEPSEVRITACGERRTKTSHPVGWWGSDIGTFPLQRHAIHCGAESIIGQPHNLDVGRN